MRNSSETLLVGSRTPDTKPSAPATPDGALLVVEGVSKRYEIYERPQDRLKQFVVPRLQTLLPLSVQRSQPFYKEFWALRDVSLSLKSGEALGILGRNGAGKSTLLQIIAGTLAPTLGTVTTHGKIAALLELGSGFSPDFTGSENVRLNAALLGLSASEIDDKFDAIAAFADIGDFIDQPVKTYSSGMMLRLAFAVQTAIEPALLIVDEALAVGDARFQKKCFTRLQRLLARGTAILLVTHDTGAIVQFCSSAVIIDGGKVVARGDPAVTARRYHELLFSSPQDESESVSAAGLVQDMPNAQAEAQLLSGNSNAQIRALHDASGDPAIAGAVREQPGADREVRYGSKDAEIVEVGIRDDSGSSKRLLETHSVYEFYYKVRFNIDINGPLEYGFIIANRRGVEVFGTKAGLHGRSLRPGHSGSIYECRLRAAVPLIAGTYFLTVAVGYDDGRPGEYCDCRFDALQFEVAGTTRAFTTCVIDMNGEVSDVRLASR